MVAAPRSQWIACSPVRKRIVAGRSTRSLASTGSRGIRRVVITWLPGPLLALIIVALAFGGRVGPGALLMAIVLSIGLFIGAPVLQLILNETNRFRGRYFAACLISLGIVVVAVFVASFTGVFNFW
jgi:hypothetical protein